MRSVVGMLLLVASFGCGERGPAEAQPERRGPAPPAAASTGPLSCTRESIDDAATKGFFPAKSGAFCLDPADGSRAMGEGAKLPLERMCDLFDGECAVYEALGVKRVVALRYVAQGDKNIDVVLSQFVSPRAAHAMFTKRTVGDGDPADSAAPSPMDVKGLAALGIGNGYLVRGSHLVELTYTDPKATPAEIETAGRAVLESLVREIDLKLPDEPAPSELALLPKPFRLPMGVRLWPLGVFPEVKEPAVVGYYQADGKRWRIAIIAAQDEGRAKSTLSGLGKLPGGKVEPALADGGQSFTQKDAGNDIAWLAARKGNLVAVLGDEPRVLRAGADADERAKISLSADEKRTKLEALLATLP